jgi:alkylation response protein AidB-like acyl-CoA dehydrogenase
MNFEFSEEQKLFRESVAKFVDKEVLPVADEIDRKGEFPQELFSKCAKMGYLGLRYPEEFSGSGGDMVLYCILCEELARGSMSLAMTVSMQAMMATDFIYRYGTDDHKKRLLVPALRGEKIGAFALTEPNAGSDLGAIQTTAVHQGDSWVLNGPKMWITNASNADFFTVLASTDRTQGIKAVDFFLVEKGTHGLIVGKKIDKLGVRACDTGELTFDNCAIPLQNLLGVQGSGFKNLLSILSQIRVMTGALGLGLSRAALALATEYSKQRVAFERPIAKFQAIQHKIADIAADIELSRLMVYYAAWLIDKGERCTKEAAIAKLFATEAANRAADEASRIFASYGFAMEYPIQRHFRDARFLLLGGGTSEILRNIIAGEVIGKI